MAAVSLLETLEWSRENEAIRFFQPHGGQIEFIRDIEKPGAYIAISGAGNGWGKSELIVAIFAAVMWPQFAPPALAGQTFTDWKWPKRARIYSTPAELEQIGSLQTAIAKIFPKGRYSFSKGRYSYPSIFETDTGWVLDLFSYERDAAEAAGPNIGLQAVNEPPPEELWKEILARSRAGGLILGGLTSLRDNPWFVDGVLAKHDGKNVRIRYGNSCENCKQHGVNGNLEHEHIERMLEQYDADEREARFSGKPLVFSGRVFKSFDRKYHVKEFEVPSEDVSHGMICDPAIGKPLAIAWRFVDRAGIVHYYDEYPGFDFNGAKDSNLTVADYVQLIKAKEEGRTIDSRILDRHFGNVRRTLGGRTLKEEFSDHGLDFSDSYTMDPAAEVEAGILKVKSYLNFDKSKPIDSLNGPRIVIHPRCRNLIAAFERWGRDAKTGKPREEFKDFMDLARYDLMTDPQIETAVNWPKVSKPFHGAA